MKRNKLGIGLWSVVVVAGCANDAAPGRSTLQLSVVGSQRRDRVVVRATVTNESRRAVAWDREFCAHMHWKVVTAGGQAIFLEKLASLPNPPASEFKNRFAILEPGESLAHDFELTYLLRVCTEGYTTSLAEGTSESRVYLHRGIFHESVGRFRVPETEDQVTVSLAYVVVLEAYGGFSDWFGHDQSELPLESNEIVSNNLAISFR
jgi:hypothetical protein